MPNSQPGILAPVPPLARCLSFQLQPDGDPLTALAALAERRLGDGLVVGIGQPLALALGCEVPGLRGFPALCGPGLSIPSTQAALWCWLRGTDRGELMHAGRTLEADLDSGFEVEQVIDTFVYAGGRDLTGYEDGTENPTGDDALAAGILADARPGLAGSSFAAVQQWVHDFEVFEDIPLAERDDLIGRRQSDNEELEDAPPSAHVKRTAQEDFSPPAFVVRRSMPWADDDGEGLLFLAFGRSLDAYDALLRRMIGAEDGIVDGLFQFTRPITGGFYWCPPAIDGKLDLRAIDA
ncbi:MAG: Dyp-type peroxidase [Deltaproteobacteria bacterium]|jgi:putative iron-dependent peroxidase|nr:Dyp-type peroxidase [Deltaproteobacteria bacterium]